jgi:hypothetical protein
MVIQAAAAWEAGSRTCSRPKGGMYQAVSVSIAEQGIANSSGLFLKIPLLFHSSFDQISAPLANTGLEVRSFISCFVN